MILYRSKLYALKDHVICFEIESELLIICHIRRKKKAKTFNILFGLKFHFLHPPAIRTMLALQNIILPIILFLLKQFFLVCVISCVRKKINICLCFDGERKKEQQQRHILNLSWIALKRGFMCLDCVKRKKQKENMP